MDEWRSAFPSQKNLDYKVPCSKCAKLTGIEYWPIQWTSVSNGLFTLWAAGQAANVVEYHFHCVICKCSYWACAAGVRKIILPRYLAQSRACAVKLKFIRWLTSAESLSDRAYEDCVQWHFQPNISSCRASYMTFSGHRTWWVCYYYTAIIFLPFGAQGKKITSTGFFQTHATRQ